MISEDDQMLLSAYLDNELSGEDGRSLKERLLQEPELRRELDSLKGGDEVLLAYSSRIDGKPMPSQLEELFSEQHRSAQFSYLAAAASIIVMVGGFLLLQSRTGENELMEQLASGERADTLEGYIEVVARFRHQDGFYCREVMTHNVHAVLCAKTTSKWLTAISIPRTDSPDDTYQPAGVGALDLSMSS